MLSLNWSKCKAVLLSVVSSSEAHLLYNLFGKAFAGLSAYISFPYLYSYFKSDMMGYLVLYQMIFTWLMVMDFGFGNGVNRIISQEWQTQSERRKAKQYFYAVEKLQMFLILGFLVLGLIFYGGSQVINFQISKIYLGITLALISYYPVMLYMNALMGMLKFFQLNCFHVLYVLCKFYGAIFLLYYYQMSIQEYFFVQSVINCLYVIALRIMIHRNGIAVDFFNKTSIKECKAIKGFSLDMGLMSILTILIVQLDKWYLLANGSFSLLGNYGMLWSLGSVIIMIATPFSQTYIPSFTLWIHEKMYKKLRKKILVSSFVLGMLTLPLFIVMILYSKYLLCIWFSVSEVSQYEIYVFSFLLMGFVFSALNSLLHGIRIAYGWTKLSLYLDIVAVLFALVPGFFLINRYQMFGASIVWLLINTMYFIMSIYKTFNKVLKGIRRSYVKYGILLPLVYGMIVQLIFRNINFMALSKMQWLLYFLEIECISFLIVAIVFFIKNSYKENAFFKNL